MKITIHRGANQIGGCITEIATKDAKIFIDLGSNLPGSDKTDWDCIILYQHVLSNIWEQEPLT